METISLDLSWPLRKVRNLMRRIQVKQDPVYKTILMMLNKSPLWTKQDIARLTKAGYQNCSTVYACVKNITEAAAGVPWKLFQRPASRGGKKAEIEDHEVLDLLKRPNPQEGGATFVKNALAFYLIAGNAYLIRIGPTNGLPKEIYTMRPDRVRVLPGTTFEPIGGYRYSVGGIDHKPDFKPNEVLHLKMFHPLDDWYGLSPIEVAAKEIDIANMGREWNMKLLQNDCRPPGALTTEGTLEDESRDYLKKQFKEEYGGYQNVATPLILEGGLKWEAFAITPKDMDYLNSDKMTGRKICSVYNVAPELIGDSENKTYSNYQEARKALYIETVMPLLDYLRDELNNWLTPAFGERLTLEYDKNSIEAIREEMSAVFERMERAWWLTINARRRACGEDDVPGGDIILVPSNLIPLSDISANITEE